MIDSIYERTSWEESNALIIRCSLEKSNFSHWKDNGRDTAGHIKNLNYLMQITVKKGGSPH